MYKNQIGSCSVVVIEKLMKANCRPSASIKYTSAFLQLNFNFNKTFIKIILITRSREVWFQIKV